MRQKHFYACGVSGKLPPSTLSRSSEYAGGICKSKDAATAGMGPGGLADARTLELERERDPIAETGSDMSWRCDLRACGNESLGLQYEIF